jgi:hypothetical protein
MTAIPTSRPEHEDLGASILGAVQTTTSLGGVRA